MLFSSVIKLVNPKLNDDIIIISLDGVRLYACIFNPMKFDEDWMKNKRVIVFTSKCPQTDRQTDGHYDYNTPLAEG